MLSRDNTLDTYGCISQSKWMRENRGAAELCADAEIHVDTEIPAHSGVRARVDIGVDAEFPSDEELCSWRGWELPDSSFGGEFDLEARKRMVQGGRRLLPLLHKYRAEFGTGVLEIGAFFVPLLTPQRFPEKEIAWCDNDANALSVLSERYGGHGRTIQQDLNRLSPKRASAVANGESFDAVVVSQVLNYVDHRALFEFLPEVMTPGGHLFLNNVADYGIPDFFHDARPRSARQTVANLESAGFKILETEIIASPHSQQIQKNERLLLVASLR